MSKIPHRTYKVICGGKIPANMRDLGFIAYVEDSHHPDGPYLSCSWHQSLDDAYRTAEALNEAAQ